MKTAYSYQMKEIDAVSIREYRIPGVVLMEAAGISVAKTVLEALEENGESAVIVAGQGNNGGDGFVVARHLLAAGVATHVFFVGSLAALSSDSQANLDILAELNIVVHVIRTNDCLVKLSAALNKSRVVVDALLGTGINRRVDGIASEVIKLINASGTYVVSVDVPSGICADTGHLLGNAVLASKTVSFCLPKTGMLLYPAAEYVGELTVANIGIPPKAIVAQSLHGNYLSMSEAKAMLPKRQVRSNKSSHGKVCAVVGSDNMPGAAILCCKAAYRTGAGLVCGILSRLSAPVFHAAVPEAISLPRDYNNADGTLLSLAEDYDVYAVGCGLGSDASSKKIVQNLLSRTKRPIVLDADGLNNIADDLSCLGKSHAPIVITPHPGEMARLTQMDIPDILSNPIKTATDFAKKYGVVVLLKDARTIIANPAGEFYINTTGHPCMAKAGSGDVLTGVIAGLIAQGMTPFDAAVLGAYIHGLAGECCAERFGSYSPTAMNLIDELYTFLTKSK